MRRSVWWLCECGYSVLARRRPSQCEGCGSLTTPWLRVELPIPE